MKYALTLLLALFIPACSSKGAASKELASALQDGRDQLVKFTRSYGEIERDLQKVRTTDPAAAAKKIQTDMLPAIEQLVTTLGQAREKGQRYLDEAKDEDPAAIDGIRRNLDKFGRMVQSLQKVHDLYAEEAHLLEHGPVPTEDRNRLNEGIMHAFGDFARG
jgi:hypothetical protein